MRSKGKINRVSIERLCAGPAVPLIYEFLADKFSDLTRIFPKENFNLVKAKNIIEAAIH